jgi:hypothetical protein
MNSRDGIGLRTALLAAVNCKVQRLSVVLQLPVVLSCVYNVSINPIIQSIPHLTVTTLICDITFMDHQLLIAWKHTCNYSFCKKFY